RGLRVPSKGQPHPLCSVQRQACAWCESRSSKSDLSLTATLPPARPEGRTVRAPVSPRIVSDTRSRPPVGWLVLAARLRGVSIHHRLALGGRGGCGAGVRGRVVGRHRLAICKTSRPA